MSAAGKRAELETAVANLRSGAKNCRNPKKPCRSCDASAAAVLAAADAYAAAQAREYADRMTPDQLRARLRLAEATAEADGKPS